MTWKQKITNIIDGLSYQEAFTEVSFDRAVEYLKTLGFRQVIGSYKADSFSTTVLYKGVKTLKLEYRDLPFSNKLTVSEYHD